MSGIVGIASLDGKPCDRRLLEAMTRFQVFRGPDGQRTWSEGGTGLGHSLLRLSDCQSEPPQPASLDGRVWITADARIDGQAELRTTLRGAGRDVPMNCDDAELLLHAYHAWGTHAPERLIGDFSFAIWDESRRQLFCAIDHFGIRPLYYARIGATLVFSNTLDCVRLHPDVPDTLDDTAVGDFLMFGMQRQQESTIYRHIRRLKPRQSLLWRPEGLTVSTYPLPAEDPESCSEKASDVVTQFKALLDVATRDRMRSRRVSVFLSGGLDSTTTAASCVQVLRSDGRPYEMTAFTTALDGLISDDESQFARSAADRLGIGYQEVRGDHFIPFDWVDWIRQRNWHLPEPVNDPALSHSLDSFEAAAASSRQVLTGWEGDEPLRPSLPAHWRGLCQTSQYRRLFEDLWWFMRHQRQIPPLGLRTAIGRWRYRCPPFPDWIRPEFSAQTGMVERWRDRWESAGAARSESRHARMFEGVHWSTVFDGYDAGSSGVPVVGIHPLMDLRVVAFLLRLPEIPWRVDKHILREAGRLSLPEAVVNRPKTPLSGDPVKAALDRHGMPRARLLDSLAAASDYVEAEQLARRETVEFLDDHWTSAAAVNFGCWLNTRRRKGGT